VAHTNAEEGIKFDDLLWEQARYKQLDVYGHSKLANILHARELNRRLSDRNVTAYSVHPGLVATGLGSGGDSFLGGLVMKVARRRLRAPEDGAATSVWVATDPDATDHAGGYFEDSAPTKSTRHAKDDNQAAMLWEVSQTLVGI